MNKTILRLDEWVSIVVLSGIAMLFTFISGYSPINSVISFLFVVVKCVIFVLIPSVMYLLEKNNMNFKRIAGIYASYFIINLLVTVLASVSVVNGIISNVWKFLFDLINLLILLSSALILIEQVLEYAQIKNKVYSNTIMRIVYLVANFVSYPLLMFINKKINDK